MDNGSNLYNYVAFFHIILSLSNERRLPVNPVNKRYFIISTTHFYIYDFYDTFISMSREAIMTNSHIICWDKQFMIALSTYYTDHIKEKQNKSRSGDRTWIARISRSTDLRLRPLSHNNTHNLTVLIVDIENARVLYQQ